MLSGAEVRRTIGGLPDKLKTFSCTDVISSDFLFLIFLLLTSKFHSFIIMINPMNRRVTVCVHQRAGTEWKSGGTGYSEPHL